jgi:hypothetical protein
LLCIAPDLKLTPNTTQGSVACWSRGVSVLAAFRVIKPAIEQKNWPDN